MFVIMNFGALKYLKIQDYLSIPLKTNLYLFLVGILLKIWGWKFVRKVFRPKRSFIKSVPGGGVVSQGRVDPDGQAVLEVVVVVVVAGHLQVVPAFVAALKKQEKRDTVTGWVYLDKSPKF
jgi:hypothetical protein